MQIILEHFRSFSKRQGIPLRPLTLLVGENSSGKSSFLATVSCIFDGIRFPGSPGFNEPPYNLGTFDTIATHKGGRYGRDDYFSIGFSDDEHRREVIASYGNDHGNVLLKLLRIVNSNGILELKFSNTSVNATLQVLPDDGSRGERMELEFQLDDSPLADRRTVVLDPNYLFHIMMRSHLKVEARRFEMAAYQIMRAGTLPFRSSFSFAPIRSKPRRTYDEFSDEYSPEGDHIPTLLARLLREEDSSAESQRVGKALVRFGVESGLFKRIIVKKLGKKSGDPFQVQVGIAGPPVNLSDVGYGVSQVLPIVVQSVLKTTSGILLLQQPEVHLHPRAQAALGTFFAELLAAKDRTFLIETHSDHLVDRIRQEVANSTIPAEKVLILFFHKPHIETTVYPITLDANGNVENAPECYREFFLEEELKLLNRTAAASE